TRNITITQPSAALASTKTQVDILCYGDATGSIDLTVGGGTSPYLFSWTASGGGSVPGGQSANEDLTGLVSGTYNVLITDNNGCTQTNSATLLQPAAPLSTTNTIVDVLCYGDNTGSVDLTVSGGTVPYFYSWTSGAGGQVPVGQNGLQDLSNILSGKYYVTVTDDNGCIVKDSSLIAQPAAPLSSNVTHKDVLCHGGMDGSADVTVNGGTAPYDYLWSSGDVTASISGKQMGWYYLTITDAHLCVLKDSVFISEPAAPLSSTISTVSVNCFGGNDGTADLSVNGGTTPYTYLWNNGKTTQDLQDLSTGKYIVIITDGNLCTLTDSVLVDQPFAPLATTLNAFDVKCYGGQDGSADLTVTGGTTPYVYNWSNGDKTQDISNQITGKYLVTITDSNLCIIKDSVFIGQPVAPLASTISGTDVNCFGGNDGSVSLTITGGTVPYSYSWSNGATSKDISALILGKYIVVVTDSNNCLLTDSVQVNQPGAPLSSSMNIFDALCFASADGSIDLSVSGGTTPYSFSWSNAQTTEDVSNLAAGQYIVTITDQNTCIHKDTGTVQEPTELILSVSGTSANPNVINGIVKASATGGTPPYSFKWTGLTPETDTVHTVGVGDYFVSVTDSNGCVKSASINVPEAPLTGEIKVFPNPSHGSLTVTNLESFGLDLPIYFELYDLVGKRQMSFEIIGKDVHTFELSDGLYNNAYILRMRNERFDEIRKVFLVR
ncbi:MAG: SprB repeat-containing protein, partial [Flavobacteriales bacterium]|nr:SprB repeat-containing protein [Flavobacteriales bacterium]